MTPCRRISAATPRTRSTRLAPALGPRAWLALTLLAGIAGDGPARLLAQQDAPETGIIAGTVVEGTGSRPVPGALVSLLAAGDQGSRPVPVFEMVLSRALATTTSEVLADASGRFVFRGVPPGEYRIRASRPGWRDGIFGSDRPTDIPASGAIVSLPPGGRETVEVPLWRSAIISGRVTDESGEPITGALVTAANWSTLSGRRRLFGRGSVSTDDRGIYTLTVPAGEYVVSVTSRDVRMRASGGDAARPFLLERTFYPGTPQVASASVLAVSSGIERTGIDMQMRELPTVRVTGVLRNDTGTGRMPARVELVAQQDDLATQHLARVDGQGRFTFEMLPPGQYVLRTPDGAFPAQEPSDARELWARAAIDVADRDLDVELDLHWHLRVSGRVQFDGGTAPEGSASITLRRDDDLGGDVAPPVISTDADGRFTIEAPPGRYILSGGIAARLIRTREDLSAPVPPEAVRAAQTWWLRSAISGGRDISDAPLVLTGNVSDLVVTFTDAERPVLRGVVRTRPGQGTPDAALVLVFPADDALWVDFGTSRRFRAVIPALDGTFEATGLPDGDYFVVAAGGLGATTRDWQHPAMLHELRTSARQVVLREGQVHTLDLDVVAAPAGMAALSPPPVPPVAFDRARVREALFALPEGATIAGRVLAEGSNQPLASARVFVMQAQRETYTDEEGRFVLTGLPPGQHVVQASRSPYVTATYGAQRPGDAGTPLSLERDGRVDDVTIVMTRSAVVTGTVRDHNGQPLIGATINLYLARWQQGGREFVAARRSGVLGGQVTTDARGTYRAFGLDPGEYVVRVAAAPGMQARSSSLVLTTQEDLDAVSAGPAERIGAARTVRYAPLYFPNTTDLMTAQTITLAAGDEIALDFQLSLVSPIRVSGVVRVSDGLLPPNLSVALTVLDSLPGLIEGRTFSNVDAATGAFAFDDVPPGRYQLSVSPYLAMRAPSAPRLSGSTDLVISGDMAGVVLDLHPAGAISGRVASWAAWAAEWPGLRLTLLPIEGTRPSREQPPMAAIDADGRFTFEGVARGRYRFETTVPGRPASAPRPRVASQIADGGETIDSGLRVESGGRPEVELSLVVSEAQVSGFVRDSSGRPDTKPVVVLFAKEPQAWTPPSRRIFAVRPDQSGAYVFPDVPAGEYLIATLTNADPGDWFNPAVLGRLATAAVPVVVRAGDSQQIDLGGLPDDVPQR